MLSKLVQRAENLRQNPSITELIEITIELCKRVEDIENDLMDNKEDAKKSKKHS